MVHVNFPRPRHNLKVVYYGAPFTGKSTNLRWLHERAGEAGGRLTPITTGEGDTVLYAELGCLIPRGKLGVPIHHALWAASGELRSRETSKLVLQGADAVVFVASSDPARMGENRRALRALEEDLESLEVDLATLPVVLLWSQRDLQGAVGVRERAAFNQHGWTESEAITPSGEGVGETLAKVLRLTLEKIWAECGLPPTKLPSIRQLEPGPPAPPQAEGSPQARAPAEGEGYRPLIRQAPQERSAGLWLGPLLLLVALALAVWKLV